jgi:hypothetical protein
MLMENWTLTCVIVNVAEFDSFGYVLKYWLHNNIEPIFIYLCNLCLQWLPSVYMQSELDTYSYKYVTIFFLNGLSHVKHDFTAS